MMRHIRAFSIYVPSVIVCMMLLTVLFVAVLHVLAYGHDGRTTENKMHAPARTRKTAANKTMSNIIYTITEGSYILKALT
jgi:hypothetical protein